MSNQVRNNASNWLLLLLCSVQLMIVLDLSIVNIALPALRDDFGFDPQNLQFVSTLYALSLGAFLILAGRAGDLFGRRRFFQMGVGVFALSSLACGLAPSQTVLLAARIVQGLGAACMAPAALSLLNMVYHDEADRVKALGMWGAMSGIGGIIGFLLGGIIIDALGGKSVFFVNGVLALLVLLGSLMLLPQNESTVPGKRLDFVGAIVLAMGLGCVMFGLSQGQEQGFSSIVALMLFAAAIGLLVLFVWVEARITQPLIPLQIFRSGMVANANVVGFLLSAVIAGEGFFASLYLQRVLNYSALDAGLALLAQNLAFFLSARVGSQWVGRFGARPVIIGGLVLVGAGCLYLSGMGLNSNYWIHIFPAFLLFGAGIGSTLVGATVGATQGINDDEQGLASGLITTSQQIGGSVGFALLVTIATTHTLNLGNANDPLNVISGYQLGLVIAAGIAALGIIIVVIGMLRRNIAPLR